MAECKEVIHQLKRQQHTIWIIELNSLSSKSLLTLLTDINECQVRSLYIENSHFDSNCISQLSQIVTYNKTMEVLYLSSSPLLPHTYHLLTTALSNNEILKELYLWNDNSITNKDIPYLCDVITNNTTLQRLSLFNCPNITKFGIKQIKNVLIENKSLCFLYINGSYLRRSY